MSVLKITDLPDEILAKIFIYLRTVKDRNSMLTSTKKILEGVRLKLNNKFFDFDEVDWTSENILTLCRNSKTEVSSKMLQFDKVSYKLNPILFNTKLMFRNTTLDLESAYYNHAFLYYEITDNSGSMDVYIFIIYKKCTIIYYFEIYNLKVMAIYPKIIEDFKYFDVITQKLYTKNECYHVGSTPFTISPLIYKNKNIEIYGTNHDDYMEICGIYHEEVDFELLKLNRSRKVTFNFAKTGKRSDSICVLYYHFQKFASQVEDEVKKSLL